MIRLGGQAAVDNTTINTLAGYASLARPLLSSKAAADKDGTGPKCDTQL
jgi:hypothetical protein